MVVWQLVQCDLQPAHPIAVTCPSSSEAIDALLGTKRGSPRVVPDETKLPVTDRASRGFVRPETFRAVGHYRLPLDSWWLFVDHPFSSSHFQEPVRISDAAA
jgi:hypothetical protein